MKVDIMRSESVKPSTPTPPHLKTLKLSLLDQLAVEEYVSLVLFFSHNHCDFTSDQISLLLKNSLSETLVSFYPLAGTVSSAEGVVECDDGGATFVEAQFDGPPLSSFLGNRYKLEESCMVSFLPPGFGSGPAGLHPLLVQVTFFAAGGFALGVAVSHKLVDGATLALFMTAWATSTVAVIGGTKSLTTHRGSTAPSKPLLPDFDSGAIQFPAIHDPETTLNLKPLQLDEEERVTKRFVLGKSAITTLKAESSGLVRGPSRVEAVTALVWKCAAGAATCPQSAIWQIMNLRTRVDPPFPGNATGNLIGFFTAVADRDGELYLAGADGELVGKMRLALEEFLEKTAKKLRGDDGSVLREWVVREREGISRRSDCCIVVSTSWLRLGFYEVDFGFGKPAYVAGNVQGDRKYNELTLMDTKDGEGVEICLTLTKKMMASLECDPVFLSFVSLNKS